MISNLVSRIRAEVERAFTPPPPPSPLKGEPELPSPSFDTLRREGEGGGLVLAVSGGADSLCLADAAFAIAPDRCLKPVVAHFDHGLRGDAARADAEFVRGFAWAHGAPCVVERADVRAIAAEHRVSIEVAARDARYAFLARTAEAHGATLVALAHHADDQAETVLFRLLRGTGLAGLRGMQARSPLHGAPHLTAVRPLLRVTRADIEQYCRERNLQPRHDATNDELHHARNRIRHELLPLLAQYNPNIRAVLTRLADTAASDLEIIEAATRESFERIARQQGDAIEVDRLAWRALPAGLQREVLREAVRRLKDNLTNLGYSAIEEARDVLNSDAGVGEIALMSDVRIIVAWRGFVVKRLEIGD